MLNLLRAPSSQDFILSGKLDVAILGHRCKGNEEKWREFTRRNAAFVLRLPYWEECLAVYDQIVHVYADVEKDLAAAMRWVQALKQQAEGHRDLHALCGVYDQTGFLLRNSGDFPG